MFGIEFSLGWRTYRMLGIAEQGAEQSCPFLINPLTQANIF